MKPSDTPPPPSDSIMRMVEGELSPGKRIAYRLLLVGISLALAALLSLWLTEPGPLPIQTHVAFAALSAICLGWIIVLTLVLTIRNCPTAFDRLATGWMATAACLMFLVVAVTISLVRGDTSAAVSLLALGLTLLVFAIALVRSAYNVRSRLRTQLSQLQRGS